MITITRYIVITVVTIRRGFASGFVNYKKDVLNSQPQVIKFTSYLPMVGGSLRVHQFHQYQQNEQSSLILTEHIKDHDILSMTLEIQILV
jgi:hypothetical protein